MNEERNARIEAERKKLRKLVAKCPAKKKELAARLIDRAAFLKVQIEDLEDTMSADGYVSKYQNGENQWGTKKSPEAELHTSALKNYTLVIKQIAALADADEDAGKTDDGFDAMFAGR